MTRALLAVLAVSAAFVGGAASAPASETVNALVWQGRTVSLATLDARSFEPRGRLLALGRAQGEVHTDRLGDRLAVASAGVGVAVVDTRRAKVLWRLERGRLVRALTWISPRGLLVLEHGGALLLDPVRKTILARSDFDGVVLSAAKWSQGLVVLAFRNEGSIEPARLFVIGPSVRVRGIELSRIAAGWASGPTSAHDFNHAQPGLAVDQEAGRAFVAGGAHLATVDLSTLALAYSGAERTLQKMTTGPRRNVAWLGDGVLAVAGADDRVDGERLTSMPFGLRFFTSDGVRIVDERATQVSTAAGLPLAFGHRYTDGRHEGTGLAAYDRTGALRWRLFGDAAIGSFTVVDGRAYVWSARRVHVVEIASGTVLAAAKPRSRTFQVVG